MKLRLHPLAKREMDKASRWLNHDKPGLGQEFLDAVTEGLDRIADQPHLFPQVETVQTKRDLRRYLLARFNYLIFYEILPTSVTVVAVAHGHRRPNYWLRRR